MKKYWLVLMLAMVVCWRSEAQEGRYVQPMTSLSAGIPGLWLSHELPIGKKSVLIPSLGYRAMYEFDRIPEGRYSSHRSLISYAVLSIEDRKYYNLIKRTSKGKSIEKNSGNFYGLELEYRHRLDERHRNSEFGNSFTVIPKWGIRRPLCDNLFMEASTGVVLHFGDIYFTESFDFRLKLGWRFNK